MRSGWKRRYSFSAMHFGPRARLGDTWWSVISTPVVALARLGRDDSNDESRSLINEAIYRTCNTSISRCPQCGREQATGGRSDWPISDSWECCWTDRSCVRRRGSRSTRTQARLIVDSVRFVDARRFNSPRSVHVEPFKHSSRRPTDATAGRFAHPHCSRGWDDSHTSCGGRRAAGRTSQQVSLSMNLETRPQRSCIQYTALFHHKMVAKNRIVTGLN